MSEFTKIWKNERCWPQRQPWQIVAALGLTAWLLVILSAHGEIPKSAARGSFPNPSSYRASYRLGWAGFVAARADVTVEADQRKIQLTGKASTIGIVRGLWQLDAVLKSEVDAVSLRSKHSRLEERYRRVTTIITHRFDAGGAHYRKVELPPPEDPARPKYIRHPDVLDLFGALLRFRSQPLENSDEISVIETQGTTLYVATLTVECREKIQCVGKTWEAIRCKLRLQKVGKNGQLEKHKKFKRATAWISDDAQRYVLRIESEVFIGSVFAELHSLTPASEQGLKQDQGGSGSP